MYDACLQAPEIAYFGLLKSAHRSVCDGTVFSDHHGILPYVIDSHH